MNAMLAPPPPPAEIAALRAWAMKLREPPVRLCLSEAALDLVSSLLDVLDTHDRLRRRSPFVANELSKTAWLLADKIVEG